MTVDIESLSYEELLALKHMIEKRIKQLDATAEAEQALPFRPGDTVSFGHPRQGRLTGTLIKYNRKTVTVLTSSGQQWDVSPNLLRRVRSGALKEKSTTKIIDISSRQN